MALDELYIYNLNFEKIAIIDNAESVIWTERFDECGDFEIYMRAEAEIMRLLTHEKFACYVTHRDSDMVGLIEKYTVEMDDEQNQHVIISGRCAVSLLSRRVIANQEDFKDKYASDIINELILNNIIESSVAARNIDRLQYVYNISNADTVPQITGNYFGKNLYECVVELCRTYGYGIKSRMAQIPVGGTTKLGISISLYQGVDRTGTGGLAPVTFALEYDNLQQSTYSDSEIEYVNAALVSDSGDTPPYLATTFAGSGVGIRRKEIYVELKNVKYRDYQSNYEYIWRNYGNQELAKYHYSGTFDAQANSVGTYEYKKHYNLGDRVAIATDYGYTTYATVTEVTACLDDTGYHLTPKLKF